MTFRKAALATSLILALTTVTPLQAADFSTEYKAYQTELEARNFPAALAHIEAAYQAAESVYGKNSRNYANLGFSLANTLAKVHHPSLNGNSAQNARALALYRSGIAIYQQLPDVTPTEIITQTINAIEVTDNAIAQTELLEDALKLAKAQNQPELVAATQVQGFESIAHSFAYREKHNVMLKEAFDFFQTNAATYPKQYLHATYLMAQIKYAKKKYTAAETYFLDVLKQTKELNFSHPLALGAHARLVDIYEQQGKSAQATPHCIAIGSMTPWNNNQDPVPLFRKEPEYPMSAARARKDGYAKMKFTITPEGSITNIEVLETQGSSAFGTKGVEALAKWRYAPKFENGKAVPTESVVQLDYKIL